MQISLKIKVLHVIEMTWTTFVITRDDMDSLHENRDDVD